MRQRLAPITSGLATGFVGHSDPTVGKIVGGKLYRFSAAERVPPDAQLPEAVAQAKKGWDMRR